MCLKYLHIVKGTNLKCMSMTADKYLQMVFIIGIVSLSNFT